MKRDVSTPKHRYGDRNKYTIDPITRCWIWTGAVASNGKGYGYLKVGSKVIRAHRYFWEQKHGPIPEGEVLHHLCENPRCVNPDHVVPTTKEMNHKLAGFNTLDSREKVEALFSRYLNGETQTELAKELGLVPSALSHAFSRYGLRRR